MALVINFEDGFIKMESGMRDYKKLKVWERAHTFTIAIYRLSSEFPSEEKFGLISQIRRSSASIATNIAEGCGRYTNNEFARFIDIASGSASEAEYQLLLAHDLGFIPNTKQYEAASGEISEIKKMLRALRSTLTPNS